MHSSFWLCLKVTESRSQAAQLASRTPRHCSCSFFSPSASPLRCHSYTTPCSVLCSALVYRKRTTQQGHFCLFSSCSGESAAWLKHFFCSSFTPVPQKHPGGIKISEGGGLQIWPPDSVEKNSSYAYMRNRRDCGNEACNLCLSCLRLRGSIS